MPESNGTPVSWRELNLLRETIDRRFNSLEDKIDELIAAPKASSARRLSYLAIVAAVIGDLATVVWLTH